MPPKAACQNCAQLLDSINDLKATVASLKREIESLKQSVEESSNNVQLSGLDFETIVQEVEERNTRKCNLIIYNIPEQQAENPTERKSLDNEQAMKVIRFISPTVNIDDLKPIRLGKLDPTKHTSRPLRIRLRSEGVVGELLKKASSLKTSQDLSRIIISPDRTPRQSQYYQTVKTELNRRTAGGETNLKIKYIRGIPQIVSSN